MYSQARTTTQTDRAKADGVPKGKQERHTRAGTDKKDYPREQINLTPPAAVHERKENVQMSSIELVSKIEALKEWEALAAEAAAEVEAIKDSIKAEMITRNVEELEAGRYIARFTSVLSSRFDTTTFKKEHGEMYKLYTKQTTSRRFSIA